MFKLKVSFMSFKALKSLTIFVSKLFILIKVINFIKPEFILTQIKFLDINLTSIEVIYSM